MSFMTKVCVVVAAALCAMQVQAATVEVVADVAVTSYQKLNTAQGPLVYDNLLASVPQHFDFTVRFDTDNPLMQETDLTLNPLLRYARLGIHWWSRCINLIEPCFCQYAGTVA